jgi:hypothetical protein
VHFREGERLFKTPAHVLSLVGQIPVIDILERYVVFSPLRSVPEGQTPVAVGFVANPLRISVLVTLATYDRF